MMAAPLKPWQVGRVCPNNPVATTSLFRGLDTVSPETGSGRPPGSHVSATVQTSSAKRNLSEVSPPWSATPTAMQPSTNGLTSRNGSASTTEAQIEYEGNLETASAPSSHRMANRRSFSYSPTIHSSSPGYSSYGNYGSRYHGSHSARYDLGGRPYGNTYGYDSYGGFGSGRSPPGYFGPGAYGFSGAEDSWFGRVADGLGRLSHILDMNTWFLDQICDTGSSLVHRFRRIGSNIGAWATGVNLSSIAAAPFIYAVESHKDISVGHVDGEWCKRTNIAGFRETSNDSEGRAGKTTFGPFAGRIPDLTLKVSPIRLLCCRR
eukprot:GHVS01005532.1.p1 GENE.GHVS01005532.1~~GHVS01005532.1.p1  ORF type:complete len:320 (+),score=6.00 GHVS01005532.1:85-1044(+)